jgi:hypothetical protein
MKAAVGPAAGPEPPEDPCPVPERVQPLREAERLICGARNASYGEPAEDLGRTAEFWTTYLRPRLVDGMTIRAHDVALMMDLLKTSRLVWSPGNHDSFVDKVGYTAIAWECAVAEAQP